MPRLEFYFAPGTSSMAPHIALHEVGAQVEARPLSFAADEHREASFLAINPEGKVPVLVVDGQPLTEVAGSCSMSPERTPRSPCSHTTSRPRRR
jgi:glutathione S-transferase